MPDPDYVAFMPFAQLLGITISTVGSDEVVGALDWAEDRATTGGVMHGGALMSLADSVGAVCAFLNVPDGATTSTTSSSTVFLRGVRSGTVIATARPIHVGRSTIAVVTELRDADDRPVAQVTQTQAVLAAS
ncbi:MAG TPA: PaaI family thioesterase [Jatrophihabitantaceae bacterium]|nr:PaaI family thioesterase [Jatrophihabitantaceae bacterium]